jgi:hypothetical protein
VEAKREEGSSREERARKLIIRARELSRNARLVGNSI